MGKVNAIIEIFVIGTITLIVILTNIMALSDFDKSEILKVLVLLKDYSNMFLIFILALSYQLGWIMNGFTGYFYPRVLRDIAKKKYKIDITEYQKIRHIVYLKASDNALSKIKERLSGIRLLRSSIINIFFAIVAFLVLEEFKLVMFLLLPLLIIASFVTHHMYDKYTAQIFDSYQEVKDKKDKEII